MPSRSSSTDIIDPHSHSHSHTHTVQLHRPGYDAQGNRLNNLLLPASPPRFHYQLRRVQSLKLKSSLQSFFPLPPVKEAEPAAAKEETSEERLGSVKSSKAHIVSAPQTSAAHCAVHALEWDSAQSVEHSSPRVEQSTSLGALVQRHHHHQREQHRHHHHRNQEDCSLPEKQDTHPS